MPNENATPLLQQLIDALRCLPGVGGKTAQRMALHLLERDRDGARHLSRTLAEAAERIGNCASCRNLTEDTLCAICRSPQRDASLLCVVEGPVDLLAIEQATGFRGRYFVLFGRLSPLDALGPRELGMDLLERRLSSGEIQELIIATNPTVEGEATAHYVAQLAGKAAVAATRLAHGVPLGGELEFIDRGTLAHAFGARAPI